MKARAWLRKSCPHCKRGDLYLHNGLDGWEWVCLQCSRSWDVDPATKMPVPHTTLPPIEDPEEDEEKAVGD